MAKPSVRHMLILAITTGIGVGLSAIATLFVYRWEVSQQQNQFQRQIENLAIALQRSLNRYTDVLNFLGDYYSIHQDQVERQAFNHFVKRSLVDYPGIQALEWAPVVSQDQRQAYERAVQQEGYSGFQITELGKGDRLERAAERPYYIPVTYLAPFVGNEAAFGFDVNSSPARVAAIDPARDSGKIHATGRVKLVQEQRDQYGFLVVFPRYQSATIPVSVTERRYSSQSGVTPSQFSGVLLGVFRISDVVEETVQDLSFEIDFALYDQQADPDQQFLGRYHAQTQTVTAVSDASPNESALQRTSDQQRHGDRPSCASAESCARVLNIGQRQWQVTFFPAPTYRLNPPYATWATLLVGPLLTGSLVLFLRNLQNELTRTQQLNDLKLRFFSMASHELRTPLSTILLSTESLQVNDASLSSQQKQNAVERIHQTAQQMGQQITDLLTLTRAEVGKLEFNPALLDVSEFCQQVINELQSGIRQPIEFASADHGVKAFWDRKLMRSLLSNLLTNAAKYSPPDQPIHVSFSSDGEQATLQVRDRGIGIPPADLNRIQEAFQRGSNVGDISGTGLGLAIVKVGVDLHKGEWHINSKEEQGTTVVVTLPLE